MHSGTHITFWHRRCMSNARDTTYRRKLSFMLEMKYHRVPNPVEEAKCRKALIGSLSFGVATFLCSWSGPFAHSIGPSTQVPASHVRPSVFLKVKIMPSFVNVPQPSCKSARDFKKCQTASHSAYHKPHPLFSPKFPPPSPSAHPTMPKLRLISPQPRTGCSAQS